MKIDALIPARGGSKRIPNKNMKELAGKPLIYWTMKAAEESGIFARIVVSTEDKRIAEYCKQFVEVVDRPPEYATDTSPDVEWIKHYLENYKSSDYFMILRPTSPFRTPESICLAWEVFQKDGYASSLRAVSPVRQHPGKMWTVHMDRLVPLLNYPTIEGHRSYNLPTQMLPRVYVQNACIEIGHINNVLIRHNVSGHSVMPFFMDSLEALDLNTLEDWILAEYCLNAGMVKL